MTTIEYVYMLPYQCVEKVWFYLDDSVKSITCKEYYDLYHHLLKPKITNYNGYIRSMIRDKCDFILGYLLKENFKEWNKINHTRINYNNKFYYSYLQYVIDMCIYYKSDKCKELILSYTNNNGYNKKSHKNIKVKNIKWTN